MTYQDAFGAFPCLAIFLPSPQSLWVWRKKSYAMLIVTDGEEALTANGKWQAEDTCSHPFFALQYCYNCVWKHLQYWDWEERCAESVTRKWIRLSLLLKLELECGVVHCSLEDWCVVNKAIQYCMYANGNGKSKHSNLYASYVEHSWLINCKGTFLLSPMGKSRSVPREDCGVEV